MDKIEYVSTEKAAKLLLVTSETIRRWCVTGKLRGAIRPGGSHYKIPMSEIERMLEPVAEEADGSEQP